MTNTTTPITQHMLLVPVPGQQDIKIELSGETPLGEPQCFVEMQSGTLLEITYESEGIPEDRRFYSVVRHCSEDDFDNDVYKESCGIISTDTTDSLQELKDLLTNLFKEDLPIRA